MHHADGIILCSIENEWEMLNSYLSYGKLIACNEYNEDQSVSMIRAKQYEGFYKATEYLLSKEKRGIAYCTGRKGFSTKDTLELLRLKSRDNARTPMQWSTEKNAGFSEAQPWIRVNANYKKINAENALADSDSVFYYYQKLIALRHELPIITDGVYELLDAENEKIYAYLRKGEKESLIVLCNFTDETVEYEVDESVKAERSKLVISNYKDAPEKFASKITMKPYGAYVYYTK